MQCRLRVIACMCHYSGLLAAISLDFHRGFRQSYLPKIKLQCSTRLAARDCGAGPPPFIVVRSIRTPRSLSADAFASERGCLVSQSDLHVANGARLRTSELLFINKCLCLFTVIVIASVNLRIGYRNVGK